MIGTLQVPLHRIDQQKHQFMIFMQKEVASQVTDPLRKEVLLVRQLHRMNVSKGSIMSKHLCIDSADHVLLHLFGGYVWRAQVLLQNCNLSNNNLILFLLGA